VGWSDQEIRELLEAIKDEEGPGQKRDATGYEVKYKGETFPVNLEKIPPSYKSIFDDLKENLQIVKK
jgi:hypothetical protein